MSNIDISDLTTKETDGTGVFDELMETMDVRLQAEYQKGRIKGPDYAKVYLGSMEAIVGQSIQFLLGKQTADKQADLIAQQTLNAVKEGAVLDQEVLFSIAKVSQMAEQALLTAAQVDKTKQDTLNAQIQGTVLIRQAEKLEQEVLVEQQNVLNMEQQVLKSIAEVSMMAKQEIKIDAEILIAQQQIVALASEIALTNAKIALLTQQIQTEIAQTGKIAAEVLLVNKQVVKITNEIALMAQQILNMQKEFEKITAEVALMEAKADNEVLQGNIIINQAAKIIAERDLLIQKSFTEEAQRKDSVDGDDVAGVIGQQNALYTAQRNGFARDAEQKLAKILTDTWNVRMGATPDETYADGTNELHDSSIGAVIQQAKLGIGVTQDFAPTTDPSPP